VLANLHRFGVNALSYIIATCGISLTKFFKVQIIMIQKFDFGLNFIIISLTCILIFYPMKKIRTREVIQLLLFFKIGILEIVAQLCLW
jgi:hypothetical protein